MNHTLKNTYNNSNISVNNFVFTVNDDNLFPRTNEILMEQQKKDVVDIYTGQIFNIHYFFERKRCEKWLDDKPKNSNTKKKNDNKLSTVDKLMIYNSGPPNYSLPRKST
jgi:hypothetical protein